jgi:hypothetical protein
VTHSMTKNAPIFITTKKTLLLHYGALSKYHWHISGPLPLNGPAISVTVCEGSLVANHEMKPSLNNVTLWSNQLGKPPAVFVFKQTALSVL